MRPTVSRCLASYGPTFLACALVVLFAWVAFSPAPHPEPTYALIGFEADGNIYVLDYGLSLEDCVSAAPHAITDRYEAVDCEAEG